MTDVDLWENAERQAMRDVAQTPYPGRWGYTWLGGNIDPVVEPLSRTDVEDAKGISTRRSGRWRGVIA